MHISVVGLSHRTAPVEIRERLSIPEQTMETSLQSLPVSYTHLTLPTNREV